MRKLFSIEYDDPSKAHSDLWVYVTICISILYPIAMFVQNKKYKKIIKSWFKYYETKKAILVSLLFIISGKMCLWPNSADAAG
jgi:hypothetical protein